MLLFVMVVVIFVFVSGVSVMFFWLILVIFSVVLFGIGLMVDFVICSGVGCGGLLRLNVCVMLCRVLVLVWMFSWMNVVLYDLMNVLCSDMVGLFLYGVLL